MKYHSSFTTAKYFRLCPELQTPPCLLSAKSFLICLYFALLGSRSPFNLISVYLTFLTSFEIAQKLPERVGGVSGEQPQRNLLLSDPEPLCAFQK